MLATIVIYSDGSTCFYNEHGDYHRSEGVHAIEHTDGSKEWYLNGKRHRLNGPAIEYPNGTKWWYINGENYSEAAFKKIVGELC